MNATTHKRLIRALVGLAISIAAIVVLARRVSAREILTSLSLIDGRWILLLAAAKGALLLLKFARWRMILGATFPDRPRGVFPAIAFGYFGNVVLPMKGGELVRIAVLRKHNPAYGYPEALATIGTERIIDLTVLAILVALTMPLASLPPWVAEGGISVLVAIAGVLLLALVEPAHRYVRDRLPDTTVGRLIGRAISAASTGTSVLRQPRAAAAAGAWTIAVWLVDSLILMFAVRAVGFRFGYPPAILVTLLFAVGLLIPSAPAQIGTHQALAAILLAPFGIGTSDAVTISVLLLAVNIVVLAAFAALAALMEARGGSGGGYEDSPATKISADSSGN